MRNIFVIGRSLEVRTRVLGATPTDLNGLSKDELDAYKAFKNALGKSVYKHSDELLGDALCQFLDGRSTMEQLVKELA